MNVLTVPPTALNKTILWIRLLLLLKAFLVTQCSAQIKASLTAVEESVNGTIIGNLRSVVLKTNKISDAELNRATFQALSKPPFLALDQRTSDIVIVRRLDRETLCEEHDGCCDPSRCVLQTKFAIALSQRGPPFSDGGHFRILFLEIAVIDINDHTPSWPEKTLRVEIPEHSEPGFRIALVLPSDPDRSPDNTTAKFELMNPSADDDQYSTTADFSLDTKTGRNGVFVGLYLQVDADLDRERKSSYNLVLTAADGANPPRTGTVSLSVSVADINDQTPHFLMENPIVNVSEDKEKGFSIFQLKATDADPSDADRLKFKFGSSAGPEIRQLFSVNSATGHIRLNGKLDAEKRQTYDLPVAVSDGLHSAETTVKVFVTDINDHPPDVIVQSLSERNGSIWVQENKGVQMLATIIAQDRDDPKRLEPIICTIDDPSFSLKDLYRGTRNQFTLWSQHSFDRELLVAFSPIITCVDSGHPRLSTVIPLQILVEDVNDNAPHFKVPSSPIITFPENRPKSSIVLTAYATDADTGGNARIIYSIDTASQHWFQINPFTGQVRTRTTFDRELVSNFNLTLTARDCGGSPIGLSSRKTLNVRILDVNDCRPTFSQDLYEFTMTEGQRLNNVVGQVRASDSDIDFHNKLLSYHIRPVDPKDNQTVLAFRVASDGSILVDRESIDRELHPVYRLLIVAVDHGDPPLSGSATVSINVRDINDNSPKWAFPITNNNTLNVSMFTIVGTELGKLIATDPDLGPYGDVEYRIVSGNDQNLFDVDRKTGVIFLSRSVASERIKLQKLVVEAKDRGRPPMTSLGVLNIVLMEDRQASFGAVEILFGNEATILTVMVTGTLLIALLLLLTIFLIRMRRVTRNSRKRQITKQEEYPQDHNHDEEGQHLFPRYQLDAFSMPSSSELSSGSGNVCSRRKTEDKKLKDNDSFDSGQGRSSDARSSQQVASSTPSDISAATCVRCPSTAPPRLYTFTEPGGLFRSRKKLASANTYETCIHFPTQTRSATLQSPPVNSTTLV